MADEVRTPIHVLVDGRTRKLAYLRFGRDGSIYLYFPRKLGYRVVSHKDLPEIPRVETKVELDRVESDRGTPYLSYHPGKKCIHVNHQGRRGGFYRFDARALNFSVVPSTILTPFCQVLVPEFTHLDVVDELSPSEQPLIIQALSEEPEGSLSIEVWLHNVGTYFDIRDLPLFQVRLDRTKIVGQRTFQSPELKRLTATLVLTENVKEQAEGAVPGIIVAVFNEDVPYIFELRPVTTR